MVRNEQLEGILYHQQRAAEVHQKQLADELADNPRLELLSTMFPPEFAIETIGIERLDLMLSYQLAQVALREQNPDGVYMYLGRAVRAAGEENVTMKSLNVKLTAEFPEFMDPAKLNEAYHQSQQKKS